MRILLLCLLPFLLQAQNSFEGIWKSNIDGMDIYVDFDVESSTALITIPAQGLINYKSSNADFKENQVDFYFQNFNAAFVGKLEGQTISGTWKQTGREKDMTFSRFEGTLSFERPQEPVMPYPYVSTDLKFQNPKDQILLEGTLTKPNAEGRFPTIILISGSGPQDRNEEIFGHKPFLVLSDYLTNQGYAVFRYDERGIGASEGTFKGNSSEDFAEDVEAAIAMLKMRNDVIPEQIGLLGHSEGGLIAAMIGAKNNDVAFLISMAGPGITGGEIIKYQLMKSYKSTKLSSDAISKLDVYLDKTVKLSAQDVTNDKIIDQFESHSNILFRSLSETDKKIIADNEKAFYFGLAPFFLDPWMRSFIRTDASDYWKKVKVPVLALNGSKDVQVLAKENLNAIKSSLKEAGNENFKVKKMKKQNHLFQKAKTGEASEYALIETTIEPKTLAYISNWLADLNLKK